MRLILDYSLELCQVSVSYLETPDHCRDHRQFEHCVNDDDEPLRLLLVAR